MVQSIIDIHIVDIIHRRANNGSKNTPLKRMTSEAEYVEHIDYYKYRTGCLGILVVSIASLTPFMTRSLYWVMLESTSRSRCPALTTNTCRIYMHFHMTWPLQAPVSIGWTSRKHTIERTPFLTSWPCTANARISRDVRQTQTLCYRHAPDV